MQMMGFLKNAVVLGCHLFRKGLNETTYRSGCIMTKKAIVELSHFQKKGLVS